MFIIKEILIFYLNIAMNKKSYFGEFGGQYVPETVMSALIELEAAYDDLKNDEDFYKNFNDLLKNYIGRETPLYYAKNLSDYYNQDIYLKREDLNHTGAHKINNALGQVLLAKKMGKTKLIQGGTRYSPKSNFFTRWQSEMLDKLYSHEVNQI